MNRRLIALLGILALSVGFSVGVRVQAKGLKDKQVAQAREAAPQGGFSREGMAERLQITRDAEINSTATNGPKVGTDAPDFELTPLKFYEFKIDEQDITLENAGELYRPVRLSDFEGHKPVVLIFGSYT